MESLALGFSRRKTRNFFCISDFSVLVRLPLPILLCEPLGHLHQSVVELSHWLGDMQVLGCNSILWDLNCLYSRKGDSEKRTSQRDCPVELELPTGTSG